MERLGDLLALYQVLPGTVSTNDSDLELTLTVTPKPGGATVVRADDGSVTIHGLDLRASASDASGNDASADLRTGREA